MSLIDELKRRNVFKVGVVYLVVGWLVIQVAATVAPQLDLPNWTPRLITFVVLLGFPVALVLAWIFDLTPEGVRVDVASVGNKRMLAIAAVLVAAAIGWYWKGRPADPGGGSDARSIAVLPFVNMSGDAANEYFSDGISEEILNVLARTPELQVAARTSSFSFRGKSQEVPEIARALKVRMVLEGSVRKSGDTVRITAQLIDAKTGYHVWSQTYDRKLEDIFAIQDEIARAIGDELKVKLVGVNESGETAASTKNLDAYDLYLRGLALWQRRREQELWDAGALFERAIAADPEFAQAYAGAALVYAVLADYSARITPEQAYRRARDFAERALALDPQLPEPYAVLAITATGELRRDTAQALYRRAIALRPSFATAHQWLGNTLLASGDLAGALASSERASALDPRSLVVAENFAVILMALGRNADAIAVCERALELAPEWIGCISRIGLAELVLGKREVARARWERFAAIHNPGASAQVQELFEVLEGRGDRHAFALRLAAVSHRSWMEPGSPNLFASDDTPVLLVMLGERDLAQQYLERLAGAADGYPERTMMLPALDPIRCDPRFVALTGRLKMADPRAAKVCARKS